MWYEARLSLEDDTGKQASNQAASIPTHVRNTVTLVGGSLRLTPTILINMVIVVTFWPIII